MHRLNLPDFNLTLKIKNDKAFVFDIIRKKYVAASPEEWVRQNFIHFLIENLKYSKALIKVEQSISFNNMSKKVDILIYDKSIKPFLLIECKAPDVKISQSVFNQLSMYNQKIKAQFLCATNGIKHYFCKMDYQSKSINFINYFPKLET